MVVRGPCKGPCSGSGEGVAYALLSAGATDEEKATDITREAQAIHDASEKAAIDCTYDSSWGCLPGSTHKFECICKIGQNSNPVIRKKRWNKNAWREFMAGIVAITNIGPKPTSPDPKRAPEDETADSLREISKRTRETMTRVIFDAHTVATGKDQVLAPGADPGQTGESAEWRAASYVLEVRALLQCWGTCGLVRLPI
jgi:hypothetical protein